MRPVQTAITSLPRGALASVSLAFRVPRPSWGLKATLEENLFNLRDGNPLAYGWRDKGFVVDVRSSAELLFLDVSGPKPYGKELFDACTHLALSHDSVLPLLASKDPMDDVPGPYRLLDVALSLPKTKIEAIDRISNNGDVEMEMLSALAADIGISAMLELKCEGTNSAPTVRTSSALVADLNGGDRRHWVVYYNNKIPAVAAAVSASVLGGAETFMTGGPGKGLTSVLARWFPHQPGLDFVQSTGDANGLAIFGTSEGSPTASELKETLSEVIKWTIQNITAEEVAGAAARAALALLRDSAGVEFLRLTEAMDSGCSPSSESIADRYRQMTVGDVCRVLEASLASPALSLTWSDNITHAIF